MPGPTVPRRLLGAALRRLRTEASETREQVAFVLGCSATKVTYLESGRNVIGKTELIVLLQHYNAEDKLAPLEEMRLDATSGKRGWLSTARLPEWLAAYYALEAEASSVRSFELELIPGLLQTEQYAREIHILRGHTPGDDLDRRVKARLRRQERLTASDPLKLSAVVSEAALARCERQPSVAGDQFRQLLAWAQRPNIQIQVLPFGGGLHSGMSGAFTLLSFPEGLLPDTGWQEYALGGHIIDKEPDVASLATLYDKLRDQALGCDESLTLLAGLVEKTR
ncbi:MAG: helix-turn-helix domain-containing protein [Pseudonocardiaceae bacterium]